MKPKNLQKDFLRLCRTFEHRLDLLYTQVETEKKTCIFSMYFRAVKIQFVYTWRWSSLAPSNVLFCRIFPRKADDFFLHLPELLPYLNAKDYRACYFPYIESPSRMEACLKQLMLIVEEYIPTLEQLGTTQKTQDIFDDWLKINYLNDKKEKNLPPDDEKIDVEFLSYFQRFWESLLVTRYTTDDAYEAFLTGNWETSLQHYDKKKEKDTYEQGLCDFMRENRPENFQPMPPDCFSLPGYKSATRPKNDWKCIGIFYIPCAVLFCGLLAIMNGMFSHETIYYFGVEWWFGLLLGALPAIFGGLFFQKKILSFLNKKENQDHLAYFDMVNNRPWVYKMCFCAFLAATIGCLTFCIALPSMSMRFYDSYGIYYLEENGRFDYSQIEDIYYIEARYNVYEDRLERPSYVLILDTGVQVDLDACTSDLEIQENLIEDLFSEFEIILVDSDKDLPSN